MTGTVDVYKLCPKQGDSIMVVNCGSHFEVRHHHWAEEHPLRLTDQEVDKLRQGQIVWH